MRVVGCFLEYNNKFAVLLRHSHKPDGDTWCLPGGKVESHEKDEDAVLRELYEETGYQADISQLVRLGDHEFTSPSSHIYRFVTFKVVLDQPHSVTLEASAHAAHDWITAREYYDMQNSIFGTQDLLEKLGWIHPTTDSQVAANS